MKLQQNVLCAGNQNRASSSRSWMQYQWKLSDKRTHTHYPLTRWMKIWGFPSVHPGTCKAFLIHSAFYVTIGDITMQISVGSLSLRTGLIYKTSWNPIPYWAGCEGKAMWVWASAFKGRFLIYGSTANTLMDFKFSSPTRRSQPPEKITFKLWKQRNLLISVVGLITEST